MWQPRLLYTHTHDYTSYESLPCSTACLTPELLCFHCHIYRISSWTLLILFSVMDSYLWHNMDLLSIFILLFYPSIFGYHVYFLKPGLSFLDNLAHLQKQSVIVLFTCIADACFLFVAFVGYFQASEGHTWGHPNMLSSSMSWLRIFFFFPFH